MSRSSHVIMIYLLLGQTAIYFILGVIMLIAYKHSGFARAKWFARGNY